MKQFVLAVGVVFLLTGCATTGGADYAALEQSSTTVADSPYAALANANVIPLAPGEHTESRLELSDPTLRLAGWIANYRIFAFTAPHDGSYRLQLMSLCNCIGFYKKLMRPIGFVLDSDGAILNNAPDTIGYMEANWTLPGRIEGTWTGAVREGQTYYFLVTADNRTPGDEVASSSGLVPAGAALMPISVSLKSAPAGKIRVAVAFESGGAQTGVEPAAVP